MTQNIGWRFPPTGGGQEDGFQHMGLAHFSGSRLRSLARETTQNSLDARLNQSEPVEICFELDSLKNDPDFGRAQLREVLESCASEVQRTDSAAASFLEKALAILAKSSIPCLRISDRNTTGLAGDRWHTLVKTQGLSIKDSTGALGSRGAGKFALFTMSELRTVFYWSSYQKDGATREQFQGKAVLLAHNDRDERRRQGTGFFGEANDCCAELTDARKIPQVFRVLDSERRPIQGTSLSVAGFAEKKGWQSRVAASILASFFCAIRAANLKVILEPSGEEQEIEIDRKTLGDWFDHLQGSSDIDDDQRQDLGEAKTFLSLLDDPEVVKCEKQDQDLGHCELWIRVAENEALPRKVALVRDPGMLVTTRQKGLIQFQGFRNFSAIVVFGDPTGNELLRDMENPNHDQFEPDRAQGPQRARRALNRITRWIREELKKAAGPRDSSNIRLVTQLARYLPDLHPDEAFGPGETTGQELEKLFDGRIKVLERPVRRPKPSVLTAQDNGEAEGGDGDDTGHEGGGGEGENQGTGGTGIGGGEGEGTGGTGARGGVARGSAIAVRDVRLLSVGGNGTRLELSFLPEEGGRVELRIEEAGDSTRIPHRNLEILSSNGWEPIDGHVRELKHGQRESIQIRSDQRIDDRSWRVGAVLLVSP